MLERKRNPWSSSKPPQPLEARALLFLFPLSRTRADFEHYGQDPVQGGPASKELIVSVYLVRANSYIMVMDRCSRIYGK